MTVLTRVSTLGDGMAVATSARHATSPHLRARALGLVVHALSPAGLGLAPTSQLLGILAMLTLPACTIAAWAWDRSVRRRYTAWANSNAGDDDRPSVEPAT